MRPPTSVALLALSLIALGGCAPLRRPTPPAPAFAPEAATAKLRIDATEMLTAFERGDADGFLAWMPKPLVGEAGAEQVARIMSDFRSDLKRMGLSLAAIRLLETSALVLRGDDVYAVQPYQLEIAGPRIEEGSVTGYLVCISTDRGASWSFLDGHGLNGSRAKLKELLPQFPDELELPPKKPPVIKRK